MTHAALHDDKLNNRPTSSTEHNKRINSAMNLVRL